MLDLYFKLAYRGPRVCQCYCLVLSSLNKVFNIELISHFSYGSTKNRNGMFAFATTQLCSNVGRVWGSDAHVSDFSDFFLNYVSTVIVLNTIFCVLFRKLSKL